MDDTVTWELSQLVETPQAVIDNLLNRIGQLQPPEPGRALNNKVFHVELNTLLTFEGCQTGDGFTHHTPGCFFGNAKPVTQTLTDLSTRPRPTCCATRLGEVGVRDHNPLSLAATALRCALAWRTTTSWYLQTNQGDEVAAAWIHWIKTATNLDSNHSELWWNYAYTTLGVEVPKPQTREGELRLWTAKVERPVTVSAARATLPERRDPEKLALVSTAGAYWTTRVAGTDGARLVGVASDSDIEHVQRYRRNRDNIVHIPWDGGQSRDAQSRVAQIGSVLRNFDNLGIDSSPETLLTAAELADDKTLAA